MWQRGFQAYSVSPVFCENRWREQPFPPRTQPLLDTRESQAECCCLELIYPAKASPPGEGVSAPSTARSCWTRALRARGVLWCWSRLAAVMAMHISMGKEPEFDSELNLSRAHGEIPFRCSALKASVVPAPGTEPWESCRSIAGHVSH